MGDPEEPFLCRGAAEGLQREWGLGQREGEVRSFFKKFGSNGADRGEAVAMQDFVIWGGVFSEE